MINFVFFFMPNKQFSIHSISYSSILGFTKSCSSVTWKVLSKQLLNVEQKFDFQKQLALEAEYALPSTLHEKYQHTYEIEEISYYYLR